MKRLSHMTMLVLVQIELASGHVNIVNPFLELLLLSLYLKYFFSKCILQLIITI